MRFSQRIGKNPVKLEIQIDSIDKDLQNRLWNNLLENFFYVLPQNRRFNDTIEVQMCERIWKDFLKNTVDDFPTLSLYGLLDIDEFISILKKWFYNSEWYDVYDLIEFIAQLELELQFNPEMIDVKLNFIEECNLSLESEISGYRILGGTLVPMVFEEEITSVNDALSNTNELKPVQEHLIAAIKLFGDRKRPDYRNSIKESISSIEALCKIIAKDEKATLSVAISKIEKNNQMHKAFKSALLSLFGYTSDSGGIRHSLLLGDVIPRQEEAKFMLVLSSAFVNYLISKCI